MVDECGWSSRFRVHHRIADSFRDGRILLAGDAAHVHSPAGGQGMNLGIEDGVKLGEVLSRVLSGESDRPARRIRRSQASDGRGGHLARRQAHRPGHCVGAPSADPQSRHAVAGKIPAVRRRLAWRLSGLDRR